MQQRLGARAHCLAGSGATYLSEMGCKDHR
jgi:hypothetical protein